MPLLCLDGVVVCVRTHLIVIVFVFIPCCLYRDMFGCCIVDMFLFVCDVCCVVLVCLRCVFGCLCAVFGPCACVCVVCVAVSDYVCAVFCVLISVFVVWCFVPDCCSLCD